MKINTFKKQIEKINNKNIVDQYNFYIYEKIIRYSNKRIKRANY